MLTITNEDNMSLMSRYPDQHFDLALVDPPYGIGQDWKKHRGGSFRRLETQYQNTDIPSEEYFSELFRVSKNQIIWGGNYFTEHLPPTNAWIVWNKLKNAHIQSMGEMAWTSFSRTLRIYDLVWDGYKKCEQIRPWHPHQKPIRLYAWLLSEYATAGDKILDTHLGSGTIAIACSDMGYDLTACEENTPFYEEAMKQIGLRTAQMKIELS
ncbi:MAG: DNA methyltransferase [Thermonemataceae bacterium]